MRRKYDVEQRKGFLQYVEQQIKQPVRIAYFLASLLFE
jgi:hypothetical protein